MRRLIALLLLLGLGSVKAPAEEALFEEVSTELGIDFVHRHFGTGEKYMPENMGPGLALFDYDGDGRLDLYFVQGAPIVGDSPPEAANRLFRQKLDGTFEDVTERAGVADCREAKCGVGMGVAFADVDGDQDLDLFVSNFGGDTLFLNRGDGTFENATEKAGLIDEGWATRWSTGAAFADFDGDGDLDLYVATYLNFTPEGHKWCGNAQLKMRAYCHPDSYDASPDVLYRNRGDGTFEVVSREAGILPSPDAKGLGVAVADLDQDGRLDILVANDSTANHLYLGQGDGSFVEDGLLAGIAFSGAGKPEASMGIVLDDLDGDGTPDVFFTHLDNETNTLYRNRSGLFTDVTRSSGLAAPSLPWVGFGAVSLDIEPDGDLDLFVVNGHIIDNIALFDTARSHRQPMQLFLNDGSGRFTEVSERLGFTEPIVGRGAITGDFDRDGDLDLIVTQNNGPALVLRRRGAETSTCTLNLQDFGARIEQSVGKKRRTFLLHGARSYLSQGPSEVLLAICGELIVGRVSQKTKIYRYLPPYGQLQIP